ncbi:MAG: hypothetical protein WED08_02945 [Patescibacteria group bacterium]
MSRILAVLGKFIKRLGLILVLTAAAAVLLTGSNPRFLFTVSLRPEIRTDWEIQTVYNNPIGYPIGAIYRISAPVGAQVNLAPLPKVGDQIDLYRLLPADRFVEPYLYGEKDGFGEDPRYDNQGQVEVRDRVVRRQIAGGRQIVEVTYTLQYLQPIDFSRAFTEKLIRSGLTTVEYFRILPSTGKLGFDLVVSENRDATFYLVRRVEEGDSPIGDLFSIRRNPDLLPSFLKIAAAGLVGGTFAAQGWVGLRRKIQRRRAAMVAAKLPSAVAVLYARWQESRDYRLFAEAVQLYRQGFWGRPRPLDWLRTTFVLYSGRLLPEAQIREIFAFLLVLEQENKIKEVRSESLS